MARTPQEIYESLDQSATRSDRASDQLDRVANGPATGPDSLVETDSGPVPTVARWERDNAESLAVLNESLNTIQSSTATAVDAATRAENAAAQATVASMVYPDTGHIVNGGDGFDPVAEGHFASIPSTRTDGFLDLYQVVSGAAAYVDTYPNLEAIRDAIEQMFVAVTNSPMFLPLQYFGQVGEHYVTDITGNPIDGGFVSKKLDAKIKAIPQSELMPLTYFGATGQQSQVSMSGEILAGNSANKIMLERMDNIVASELLPLAAFGTKGVKAVVEHSGNMVAGVEPTIQLNTRVTALETAGASLGSEPTGSYNAVTLDEVYVRDGVLYRKNWEGTEFLVSDPSPAQYLGVPRWVGRSIMVRLNQPLVSTTSVVLVSPNGSMVIPSPSDFVEIIAGYGQSNMTGAVYTGRVVTFDESNPNMLMLKQTTGDCVRSPSTGFSVNPANITGFTPLLSVLSAGDDEATDSQGATSLEGIAWNLAADIRTQLGAPAQFVFFTSARGGRAIADLGPGSTPYVNFMTTVSRIVELQAAQGKICVLRNVIYTQGESDTGNSGWSTALRALRASLENDIQAATGQPAGVHFILAQPSTFGGTRNVLQQLSISQQYPNEFSLSHAGYPLPYAGPDWNPASPWLHYSSVGNLKKGEYEYKVLKTRTFGFGTWTGFRPKTFTYDVATRTLDVVCDVPVPPINIDPDWPSYGNNSFTVTDTTGNADFTVSVLNPTTLRFVMARDLTGTKTLSYAMRSYSTDETGKRIEGTGPLGPVHDSDPSPSFVDGAPLYNPLTHFQQNF